MRTREELPQELRTNVPQIASSIDQGMEEWKLAAGGEPPTSDFVFAALLAPLTARLLREGGVEELHTAKQIFAFLEELLSDPNDAIRDVVEVSFCEQFAEEGDVIHLAVELMGGGLKACFKT